MDETLLRALTEAGARIRLQELAIERALIVKAFPNIDVPDSARPPAVISSRPRGPRGRRQRPPMSAAQRAAVSRRMKRYWRQRRARASF